MNLWYHYLNDQKEVSFTMKEKRQGEAGFRTGKIIGLAVAVVAALVLVASAGVVVPAGSSGVVLTLGKVSPQAMSEGFHLKVPFLQHVEIITNKIQKQEVETEAVSKDLQIISSRIAVNFRISPASSASVYQNIGRNYEDVVLLPAMQESMKSVSSKYTAEELITKRENVGQEIKSTLEGKVSEYGIIIEKFNIVNFDFSKEFNDAIEAKQVAEQNLLKTKTEQEQALVIAQTEAKKKVLEAEAKAAAIQKEAEAKAEANRKLAQSLNNTVVEYEKIQKWDGKLPAVTGSTALVGIDAAE